MDHVTLFRWIQRFTPELIDAARLPPMRVLKTDRTASAVLRGHAFIHNLRRGHYKLGVEASPVLRLATAFDELRLAI